jgi:RNA polymerase sigma-70 factor, ECF subfamily
MAFARQSNPAPPLAQEETDGMTDRDTRNDFVQLLTSAQPWLFSYLVMLLGDCHDADNVLQDTNVKLWTKADDFCPGSNFRAWAREVAYYCALSFSRDRRRDRLVVDFRLVENIVSQTDSYEIDPRRIALRHCLSELDDRKLELLRQRYRDETPIVAIAEEQQKTEAAIKMSLRRLRMGLLKCIESRMSTAQ